jgi:hypothetical protein
MNATQPGTHKLPADLAGAIFPTTGKDTYIQGLGYLRQWGDGAPSDGDTDMATGASYHDTTNGKLYMNTGDLDSSTWKLVTQAA